MKLLLPNSNRNYNILFEDADLKNVKAQKEAFSDTWSNVSYKDTLAELIDLSEDLYSFLKNLDSIDISKSAVSYLTTMAIRICYMHKVLKDTGSFYLHCDPTMSHYLKIVCDLIFGSKFGSNNFINEIIWCYETGGRATNFFPRKHDTIFWYSKSKDCNFFYDQVALKRDTSTMHEPILTDEKGKKYQRNIKGGKEYRYYLDKGVLPNDWWIDIQAINPSAKERLHYPTQKPEALLDRIIKASSSKGDLVADFFCGCGTTVAVAQKLKRNWLGIDISHLATRLITKRLIDKYGKDVRETFEIDGVPKDISSAKMLAEETKGGRIKFQDWVIEFLLGGIHNPKKTADGGWDGYLTFDKGDEGKEKVLIEVKSGNVNVKNIREFIQVVSKQGAGMGAFVCFKEQVTKPMMLAVKDEGKYSFGEGLPKADCDKIQIITIEDLLEHIGIDMPISSKTTFKSAPKETLDTTTQTKLEI